MKRLAALLILVTALNCYAAAALLAASALSGVSTSNTINSAGGSLLVCGNGWYEPGGTSACTENKSNTPTALTNHPGVVGIATRITYFENPTVGSGHIFSASNSGGICGAVFTGMKTSSVFLLQNGSGDSGGAVTTIQPGSVNTSAGDLVVTSVAFVSATAGSITASVDSSFTIIVQLADVAAVNVGCALAYKIGTGSAENPEWTLSGSSYVGTAIATFDAATGGGGSVAPSGITLRGVK